MQALQSMQLSEIGQSPKRNHSVPTVYVQGRLGAFCLRPARQLRFATGNARLRRDGTLPPTRDGQTTMVMKWGAFAGADRLPCAHTCFYTVDLPHYPDRATLERKLRLAIQSEMSFAFG